jgi:cyclopropane fatty-acyl-phospholipid synthase-like methyltransferase
MSADKSWHEDDAFWKETLPVLFPISRLEEAETEVEQVLGLTEIPAGAAVLDLCCGIGRHSLELARRGFRVTGVDRTQAYLDLAAAAAKREALSMDLSHRLYSASELTFLLRNRGFGEAVAYGDYNGSPYDEGANRLVVVAQKL